MAASASVASGLGLAVGRQPGRWVGGCLLVACGLLGISLRLAPFEMLNPDFEPSGSVLAVKEYARMAMVNGMAKSTEHHQVTQREPTAHTVAMFRTRDGSSIFDSPRLIRRIREIEDKILAFPNHDHFCKRDDMSNPPACEPPGSPLNFLYASNYSLGGETNITTPDRRGPLATPAIAAVRKAIRDYKWFPSLLEKDGQHTCHHEPHHCTAIRTVYTFAGPLQGFDNVGDRAEEQRRARLEHTQRLTKELLWPLAREKDSPIDFAFLGDDVWRYELSVYIQSDAMKTVGSFLLLLAYFWFHTGSPALALGGVVNIYLSFPLAYFVYRTLLGFRINGLTTMAMFVVLGIGADDVFIVVDTWKRSGASLTDGGMGAGFDVAQRAAWVLAHAAPAMAVTSATTISAFMTSVISTVPVIQQFGVFAALVVFFNYMLVCTFFLGVVVLVDTKMAQQQVRSGSAQCLWPGSRSRTSEADAQDQLEMSNGGSSAQSAASIYSNDPRKDSAARTQELRAVEVFFSDVYAPFAWRYRRVMLVCFGILVTVSIVVASRFQLEDKDDSMLPSSSNLAKANEWSDNLFPAMGASMINIHFIWGLAGMDRSHLNPSDPDNKGLVLFDPHFDLARDQEALLAFCDHIDTHPRFTPWIKHTNNDCLMDVFKTWREANGLAFPVHETYFQSAMEAFIEADVSGHVRHHLGRSNTGGGFYYVEHIVASSIPPGTHGKAVEDDYAFWDAHAREINSQGNFSAPVIQTCILWKDMARLNSLARTAVLGMICSLSFATACMLVVTQEWRLTLFATMTIASIVASLVAGYVIMGRKLGFMESVNLAIVSGLAVDYTLHIAHVYQHSPLKTRFGRTQEALRVIGISILAAAATTLLASSMLFACYIKMR